MTHPNPAPAKAAADEWMTHNEHVVRARISHQGIQQKVLEWLRTAYGDGYHRALRDNDLKP